MDIQTLTAFFMWCSIFNGGLFLWVTLFLLLAPDFTYQLQIKFFPIDRDSYNVVIFSFLALMKIFFIFFNLAPYLALLVIG